MKHQVEAVPSPLTSTQSLHNLLKSVQVLQDQLCCNGLVNEGEAGNLNAPTHQKKHLLHLVVVRPIGLNVVTTIQTLKQHAIGARNCQLMISQLLLQLFNLQLANSCKDPSEAEKYT
jgi:hypothetical protein